MRLIDADKAKEKAECYNWDTVAIDNAPTVDAIPIEWLKNWNPKELNDTGYQVMRRIIDDWEKKGKKHE